MFRSLDFVEHVLTEMFNHIEKLIPREFQYMYTSEFAHKLLGVQISLLKCRGTERIINDIQFINTWALMQLYGVDSAMHCRPVDTDYSNGITACFCSASFCRQTAHMICSIYSRYSRIQDVGRHD